jgi:methyltransferase (TIGR00027 family)
MTTFNGVRWATVKDPFGNLISIMSEVDASEKTVERKPSDTARAVANLRFIATLDEKHEIRGRDHLAELFLPEETKTTFRDPVKRDWFVTKFLPPGMYLGLITRTAYFDSLVEEALKAHIPQIVFLGAGYDSRPYRFAELISDTRVFEVDAFPTQEYKKEILDRAGVTIPKCMAFVPTDFARDSLKDGLFSAGFDSKRKTLYIWEGVTYYLSDRAVDGMLSFIRENSPHGSNVCFDYYSTFPGVEEAYGVKEQQDFMRIQSPGERMRFSIERAKIEGFLSERGYMLVEHLIPEEIEQRFLTLKDGSSAGRITASICYAQAMVA